MLKNLIYIVLLLLSPLGFAQRGATNNNQNGNTNPVLIPLTAYKANAWVKLVPPFISNSNSSSKSATATNQKRIGETSTTTAGNVPVKFIYELWNDDYSTLIERKEWYLLDLTEEWTFYQVQFNVAQQTEETNMLVYIENDAVQGHTATSTLFIDDLVISPIDAKYSYTSNDKFGNVTYATDVNENHTRTIYDEWARPITNIDQDKEIVATFDYNTSTNFITNHNYNEVTTFVESGKYTTAREYLDGFGKPKQTIISEPTNNLKQITGTVEYDNLGRPIKTYKTFAMAGSTLSDRIITNYVNETAITYGASSIPFTENRYENWPETKLIQTHLPRLTTEASRTTMVDDNAASSQQFGDRNYAPNQLMSTTTTNEAGDVSTAYVDKQGRTIAIVTPIGLNHTVGTYGNIIFNTAPLSFATTLFEYDEANNLKKVTDPTGKVITYTYNSLGQVIKEINPDKGISLYKYDRFSRLRFSQDQDDRNLLFPASGTSDFIDHFAYSKYDKWDRIIESGMVKMSLQSPAGTVPVFNNREVINSDAYPSTNSFGREKHHEFKFDSNIKDNALDQLTDEYVFSDHILQNGKFVPQATDHKSFSYDYRGQLREQVINMDGLTAGHRFNYSYNLQGLPTYTNYTNPVNSAYNFKQSHSYDDKGRLLSSSSANGNNNLRQDVDYTYDALGRLFKKGLAPTGIANDPFEEYVAFNYNIRESLTLQMGKFFKNELRYDIKGNITTQIWNNSYFDNTSNSSPYLNHYYKYYYDKLNRLAGADYSEVEYDVNPYADIEDELSNFPSLLSCGPVVLQHANNFLATLRVEAGRTHNAFLLSTTDILQSNIAELESYLARQGRGLDDLTPSELQTYVQEFTQAILLEEEKIASSSVLLDDISKIAHQERTSSTSQAITEIEIINAIKGKIVAAPSTPFNQLIADDYDVIFNDRLSNTEKITRLKVLTAGSNNQLQVVKSKATQLKIRLVTTCSINTNALAYQTLIVDDRANRTQLNSRKYDVAYWYQKNGNFDLTNRYDELAQRTQINYTYNAANNQLASVNWIAPSGNTNSTYSYDAVGNLTADVRSGVNSIAYNQFHNLPTNMVKSNGDRHAYRYSTKGQRSVKRLSASDIEYNLGGIIVNQNDRPKQYSITDGFATLGAGNSLQKSYTITDWLGSTRLVIDAEGAIENARDHYPYGLLMNGRNYSSNPEGARFQYTGHQYDGETTFGYHGARYYNRELGRYMSMDPLAAEFANWTPYNYTLGNPINLIDPDGKAAIWKGEVNDEGQTYYVPEKGDTKETFASQYGLTIQQATEIVGNGPVGNVAGQTVFNVLGKEDLALDLASPQATSQAIFDHYLYARDHASSKGSPYIPSERYFTNRQSGSNDAMGGIGSIKGTAKLTISKDESFNVDFELPLYRVSGDGSGNTTLLGTHPTTNYQTGGLRYKNQLNTVIPFYHPKTLGHIGSFFIHSTTANGDKLFDRLGREPQRYDYSLPLPTNFNFDEF